MLLILLQCCYIRWLSCAMVYRETGFSKGVYPIVHDWWFYYAVIMLLFCYNAVIYFCIWWFVVCTFICPVLYYNFILLHETSDGHFNWLFIFQANDLDWLLWTNHSNLSFYLIHSIFRWGLMTEMLMVLISPFSQVHLNFGRNVYYKSVILIVLSINTSI